MSYRLKTASTKTQEQARLQVEEAEDKLVQMTETAIGLMKAVLENVSFSLVVESYEECRIMLISLT